MKYWCLSLVILASLIFEPAVSSAPELECGVSDDPPSSSHHRIVNGTVARKGQLPWIAYLRPLKPEGPSGCTASIISPNYILTAGHCVTDRHTGAVHKSMYVSAGVADDKDPGAVTIKSAENGVHRNPEYDPMCSSHDLAVIKLSKSLKFDKNIRSLCIKKTFNETESDIALISGYGAKKFFKWPCNVGIDPGCPSYPTDPEYYDGKLRWGTSKFVSEEKCRSEWDKHKPIMMECLSDSPIVCAKGIDHVDTYKGDSGSPISVENPGRTDGQKQYTQVGITSVGPVDKYQAVPPIYTRVSSYCDWINDVTEGEVFHINHYLSSNKYSTKNTKLQVADEDGLLECPFQRNTLIMHRTIEQTKCCKQEGKTRGLRREIFRISGSHISGSADLPEARPVPIVLSRREEAISVSYAQNGGATACWVDKTFGPNCPEGQVCKPCWHFTSFGACVDENGPNTTSSDSPVTQQWPSEQPPGIRPTLGH
ncbi:trypsin domain-containing protein [Ditylenchus destructor]|uniref:Trypsin domain-containing protein n=1 Tax=Ditylenchus destructor TaxID=166010 RepID=A0AAD4N5W2_9BILA|nr:trypsin domain-containing protein [Ditylenchus destructor]